MSSVSYYCNLMFGSFGGFIGHTSTRCCPDKSQLSHKYNFIPKVICGVLLVLTDLIQMLIFRRFYVCTIGSN